MTTKRIRKVNVLPSTYEASTIYIVTGSETGLFEFYISAADGLSVKNIIITKLQIQSLINDAVSSIAIDGQETSIKSNDIYVWRDEKIGFVVKNTVGANNPTFGNYLGNMQGYLFSGIVMNQVWCDFHIDHDIAMNTKIYPHVHWMPLTANVGTVRWGFEITLAKGHGQGIFSTPYTVYVTQTIPPDSRYRHMVAEVSDIDAILSDQIEPDTVIKIRVFRDATVDTHNDTIHAWQADLHHQISRLGTRNKEPNFFV